MASIANPNAEFTIFKFGDKQIRVLNRDGEPWFIAKDVCDALCIQNATQVIDRLDEDERAMFNIGRSKINGGGGETNIVNESGMYTLVLRCRDAVKSGSVPHAFRKWVTAEVLPSIRKTGSYHEVKAKNGTTTADTVPLKDAINMLVAMRKIAYQPAYKMVHQRFGVAHINELTKDQLPAAVEYVHKLALEGEWLPKENVTQRAYLFGDQQTTDEVLLYIDDLCSCVHSIYVGFYEQEFVRFLRKSGNQKTLDLINQLGDAHHYVGQLMHKCQSEIQQSKTRIRVEKIGCN